MGVNGINQGAYVNSIASAEYRTKEAMPQRMKR